MSSLTETVMTKPSKASFSELLYSIHNRGFDRQPPPTALREVVPAPETPNAEAKVEPKQFDEGK